VTFTAALKFCFETCVAMKFMDNDDDDDYNIIIIISIVRKLHIN